jgi:hypothetical protein
VRFIAVARADVLASRRLDTIQAGGDRLSTTISAASQNLASSSTFGSPAEQEAGAEPLPAFLAEEDRDSASDDDRPQLDTPQNDSLIARRLRLPRTLWGPARSAGPLFTRRLRGKGRLGRV